MVLYIKRCFPLKLDLNLPGQSQFHKAPTACPPHYSLPAPLQPAHHTYSLPATPTACPPHLQPARHTFNLNYTMSSTIAFSDSANLEFERYLRSPDQNNRKRLTGLRIALIKVY